MQQTPALTSSVAITPTSDRRHTNDQAHKRRSGAQTGGDSAVLIGAPMAGIDAQNGSARPNHRPYRDSGR